MAYRSHQCSATLLYSTCISVFLHSSLALSVLLPFMLCAPCPFNAPFLFSVFQLLHTASFYMPKSLSTTTTISSLFCLLIVSVHLVHAICTILFHALHAMSSALSDHHCNSSTSLAVKPMCSSSLGVMPRFLSLSNSRDS
jgi:hypothetical protein